MKFTNTISKVNIVRSILVALGLTTIITVAKIDSKKQQVVIAEEHIAAVKEDPNVTAGANKEMMNMLEESLLAMETTDIATEVKDDTGFDYATLDESNIIKSDYIAYVSTPLNLRVGPSKYADKIEVLPVNTEVHVVRSYKNGNFVKVKITKDTTDEGEESTEVSNKGYVSSTYLQDEPVEIINYRSQYSAVHLTRSAGTVQGPSGKETYYNLNMSRVVANAKAHGVQGEYWVREDGCKMMGDYIIVAANLGVHSRYSHVRTSLGEAIVLDTGGFAVNNPTQLDIATAW